MAFWFFWAKPKEREQRKNNLLWIVIHFHFANNNTDGYVFSDQSSFHSPALLSIFTNVYAPEAKIFVFSLPKVKTLGYKNAVPMGLFPFLRALLFTLHHSTFFIKNIEGGLVLKSILFSSSGITFYFHKRLCAGGKDGCSFFTQG
ncbi:hypothetical protein [Algoriphagus antarcticus]|uniref:hypothetical protein n=1 Tax=Algoriphagus antarcticus TaxID=238540 RepID=UPI000A378BF9|nr:hypothetical protein [Algoriphagus antarcticus]